MKSWKEVPHLFANGKFKIKYPEYHNPVTFNSYWYHNLHLEIDVCTLIARKIEDVKSEEWQNILSSEFSSAYKFKEEGYIFTRYKMGDMNRSFTIFGKSHEGGKEYQLMVIGNYNRIPFWLLHGFLKIGVFPFGDEHFESGELLDVNEVLS